MKIYRFSYQDKIMLGVEIDNKMFDLSSCYELYLKERNELENIAVNSLIPKSGDMKAFLQGGEQSLNAAAEAKDYILLKVKNNDKIQGFNRQRIFFEFDEINVLAPISNCGKIVCIGANYKSHMEETQFPIPNPPIFFLKPSTSIIGPKDPILILKASSHRIDYEAELAVIIGKRATLVKKEDAYDYVAGYSVTNDISDRGYTVREWGNYTLMDWFLAKAQDSFAPLGPCIVTKDEIPNPQNLRIMLRLNGELKQNSNTNEMIVKISELIEILSALMTLEPGDILSTGTPAGAGLFTGRMLRKGDIVETEIENIGILTNMVKKF